MRFRRFPAIVLALVAVALTAVIASRVAAEPDPPPPDTTPIVIAPSAPPMPSTPRTRGPADERDGGFGRTVPRPRDFDDDADRRPDRLPD